MKITSALLKPSLAEIESSLRRLLHLLSDQASEESAALTLYIEKQLRLAHQLKAVVFAAENNPQETIPPGLFEDFKKIKLRQRFAERRWKLFLSNRSRNLKMRERIDHVASVAA